MDCMIDTVDREAKRSIETDREGRIEQRDRRDLGEGEREREIYIYIYI